jgi:hypothetical protein
MLVLQILLELQWYAALQMDNDRHYIIVIEDSCGVLAAMPIGTMHFGFYASLPATGLSVGAGMNPRTPKVRVYNAVAVMSTVLCGFALRSISTGSLV